MKILGRFWKILQIRKNTKKNQKLLLYTYFVLWLKKYSQTAWKNTPGESEKSAQVLRKNTLGNPVFTGKFPKWLFQLCLLVWQKLAPLRGTTHQLTNWVKTEKFCPKFKNCTWLHGTRSQFRMCRQIQICLGNITGVWIS